MLQHNIIPLDEAKRTPSACQTCRRRKTRCDSNHPCSACVDLGETCVRESSDVQAMSSRARDSSHSAGVVADVDVRESGMLVLNGITGSGSNGLSATSMNLAPMQSLAEANNDISPENTPRTPGTNSSVYFEDVPSLSTSPFELPLPPPTETEDRIPSILSTEMQMVDSSDFTPCSRAQLIMAQIKSTAFNQFHQAWPLLHVPTFTADSKSTLLMSALSVYSMWMQGANQYRLLLDEINQRFTRALMVRTVSISRN